jgi:hypothetical protein
MPIHFIGAFSFNLKMAPVYSFLASWWHWGSSGLISRTASSSKRGASSSICGRRRIWTANAELSRMRELAAAVPAPTRALPAKSALSLIRRRAQRRGCVWIVADWEVTPFWCNFRVGGHSPAEIRASGGTHSDRAVLRDHVPALPTMLRDLPGRTMCDILRQTADAQPLRAKPERSEHDASHTLPTI